MRVILATLAIAIAIGIIMMISKLKLIKVLTCLYTLIQFLNQNRGNIMNNINTIVIYSNENISKYFLSPYVKFSQKEDSLVVDQWLFRKNLVIKCDVKKMSNFLKKLSKGLTEQELIINMQEIFAEKANVVVRKFMRYGIIE